MRKFYNANTNTTLTETEYKELIERETKEAYEEYLETVDEEKEEVISFEKYLDKMYESDTDFVEVDENGNVINEW